DKVAINSAAYSDPELVARAASRFGTQCIVASIDFRIIGGEPECFSNSGTVPTGLTPVAWAREMERLGAGEILLTSIDRDGTMSGDDIEVIRLVSATVSIPVIASGGAGSYQDALLAISEGNASAVAAASI